MISVGILDGAGTIHARRRAPRYRLLTLIVAICLAVYTGSFFSHIPHDQQPSDVQKRSILKSPLGFNDSLVSLPQELVSRAASQQLWDRKVTSGTRTGIWCMMNSDDVQAGTVTRETLVSTGWKEDTAIAEQLPAAWHESLGNADGMMNTENEYPRQWDHSLVWTDDQGRQRQPSTAAMGNIVNGEDGYIIAGGNYGPRESKPDEVPDWMLPNTKWTDIVAVQWNQYASGSDLKRIYRSHIIYEETEALMETALEKIGKSGKLSDLPLWPGVDFKPGRKPLKPPMKPATEAFMGLLGSSHGAGSAYLLIQYRALFNKKTISKIRIWKVEGEETANMLLYLD
ncbi:hypothetical protein TW65_07517 [Stemphylium lycopersici]|nr:hypothetical protein TW65_07517 [Stemphylium lycopersici]